MVLDPLVQLAYTDPFWMSYTVPLPRLGNCHFPPEFLNFISAVAQSNIFDIVFDFFMSP